MFNRFKRIIKSYLFTPLGRPDELRDPDGKQREREYKNELQRIRRLLEERNRTEETLRREISQRRERDEDRLAHAIRASREALLRDLAAPVTQLLTQHHRATKPGTPPDAGDVLAVARGLISTLELHGLVLEGTPGEATPFDPERHALLTPAAPPPAGTPVVVRFAGVFYDGTCLKKAGVTLGA